MPVDPVYVPNADRHVLQRLTRQRERLEAEVATIKRRLIALVRWASPAIEAVLPDFPNQSGAGILHDMFNPADVIKARRTTLLGLVAKYVATIPIPVRLRTSRWTASKLQRSRHGASVELR